MEESPPPPIALTVPEGNRDSEEEGLGQLEVTGESLKKGADC